MLVYVCYIEHKYVVVLLLLFFSCVVSFRVSGVGVGTEFQVAIALFHFGWAV